jgi:hypothetical protein
MLSVRVNIRARIREKIIFKIRVRIKVKIRVRIRVKCRVKIFKKGFTIYKVSQFFFLQTEGLYIRLNILSGTENFRETLYFLGTYFAFKLLKLVVSLRNMFFQIIIVSKHYTASFSFIEFHIFSDVDVQVTTATK